jgi:predicted Rossmann fold flavoprotein
MAQQNIPYDLIIIGAGAAGLIAAQEAGRSGLSVLVLEGQAAAGAKILLSGGGRCNATNAVITEKDFNSGCPRTVRHVLEHFSADAAVRFFEERGVALQLEEDGKYFSSAGDANVVLRALLKAADGSGARIEYQRRVQKVSCQDGLFHVTGNGFAVQGCSILVATGGLSYPATGSDGFGHALAKQFGHRISPVFPVLTPFKTNDALWTSLSGIAVPVRLTLWASGRKVIEKQGSLLFTHEGFSGPVVLDMSRHWGAAQKEKDAAISVDFLPQSPQLHYKRRHLKNAFAEVLPLRLVEVLLEKTEINGTKQYFNLRASQREALDKILRSCPLPISGVMGWGKAEVTAGGVDLEELKGASLESKLQPGLFFAGEVLDVDGRVGGFNLHWAWASGIAAASGVLRRKGR